MVGVVGIQFGVVELPLEGSNQGVRGLYVLCSVPGYDGLLWWSFFSLEYREHSRVLCSRTEATVQSSSDAVQLTSPTVYFVQSEEQH